MYVCTQNKTVTVNTEYNIIIVTIKIEMYRKNKVNEKQKQS